MLVIGIALHFFAFNGFEMKISNNMYWAQLVGLFLAVFNDLFTHLVSSSSSSSMRLSVMSPEYRLALNMTAQMLVSSTGRFTESIIKPLSILSIEEMLLMNQSRLAGLWYLNNTHKCLLVKVKEYILISILI